MVGIGGFLGAIARYFISKHLNSKTTFRVPTGTLAVNLIGACLLGFVTGIKVNPMILLILGTGFMGAFTTFSTLKLEMTQMYKNKQYKRFLIYTGCTYGFGILLAYISFLFGASFES